ncbi:MAG: gamma-glutamyl-gamma-aminobutyrate hydrolase family protein [Holosporales bacterium]|jgi:putative glutamine amidotransferase|nr:gamma-glutamyl-gamma-aminobutyrate hydrolase family protein [Holosporales bacterium]
MKYVGMTMRVDQNEVYHERRDALDQRWVAFLALCGLCPVFLPNSPEASLVLLENLPLVGIVFSGGDTLAAYGGTAPERDATEEALLEAALRARHPVLGVCRGLQMLHHHFGGALEPVTHPIAGVHPLRSGRLVNSYHSYGFKVPTTGFTVVELAEDGVVEDMRHDTLPLRGIMWHPERSSPAETLDIALFKEHFGV